MTIYEFRDYKPFLREFWQKMPKQGRGQARQLAEHLRVHSVVISQVLSGDRHFTAEQAIEIASFYGFDKLSKEYFITLVNRARSGSKELISHYDQHLDRIRSEATKVKSSVVAHRELSDQDKSVFYSNWYYSGVRLLSSIEGYDSVESISEYLGISRAKTAEVLSFLVAHGLCREENGRFTMGDAATFVESSSPYINGHRRNWRIKGLEKLAEHGPEDLFYASPCSISTEDFAKVREEIIALIGRYSSRVKDSPAETVACLNVDWFRF